MKQKVVYNRLKAVLAEANSSGRELAKFLGKSESTISRWCTNDIQPSVEMLFKIAKFLKVDVSELLLKNQ